VTTALTGALQATRAQLEALYGPVPALQRIDAVIRTKCRRVSASEPPRGRVGFFFGPCTPSHRPTSYVVLPLELTRSVWSKRRPSTHDRGESEV